MSNPTRWVGIDLHRRRSQVAIIDEHGELTVSRRIATDREAFTELLGDADDTHGALEATNGWEWLADLLEDAGFGVHLAHPLRTRAIAAARVKTDAIDAKTLAHLLRTGMLPEAYIAPPELRDDALQTPLEVRGLPPLGCPIDAVMERPAGLAPHSPLRGIGRNPVCPEMPSKFPPPLPKCRLANVESPALLAHGLDHEVDVRVVLVGMEHHRVPMLQCKLLTRKVPAGRPQFLRRGPVGHREHNVVNDLRRLPSGRTTVR